MLWPRACAVAEIAWMPAGPRNFEDFAVRLNEHLKRLNYRNVNYARRLLDIRATTQFSTDGQLQVKLDKLDSDSRILYTTNGREPNEKNATEYIKPITLSKTTTIRAVSTSGARLEETFYVHRAKGKSYVYADGKAGGNDENSRRLTDGEVAQGPRSWNEWVVVRGRDLDVTVDLGEIRTVTRVSANFLKRVLFGDFPPPTVEVSLSQDGSTFRDAIAQPVAYQPEGPWAVLPVVADFKTARARFVRVKARNAGSAPAGMPNEGQPTSITTDEIIVE